MAQINAVAQNLSNQKPMQTNQSHSVLPMSSNMMMPNFSSNGQIMGVKDPDDGQESMADDDDPFADIAASFKFNTGPP